MNPFLRTSTLLSVALLIAGLVPHSATGAPGGDWYTDLDQALAVARREGRPILADVGSDNCPACRKLESETLSHPQVQARLQNFVKVQINGDMSPHIRQRLGVDAYPTVIAMDPSGRPVERSVGFVKAAAFSGTLDRAMNQVAPMIAQAKAVEEARVLEESARAQAAAEKEAKAEVRPEKEPDTDSDTARVDSIKERQKKETVTAKADEHRSPASPSGSGSSSSSPATFYNMEETPAGTKSTSKGDTAKSDSKPAIEAASKITVPAKEKVVAQAASPRVRESLPGGALPAPADGLPERLLDLNPSSASRKNTATPKTSSATETETKVAALKESVVSKPSSDKPTAKSGAGSGALATIHRLQAAGAKPASKTTVAAQASEDSDNDSDASSSAESLAAADVSKWMEDADKHLKAGRKREARAMYAKVADNDKTNKFGRTDFAFIQMVMLSVDADDDALRRQAYTKIKEFKARFPNSTCEDHYTAMRAMLAADLGHTDEAHNLLGSFPKRFPTSRFKDLAYQTWKSLPPVKNTGTAKKPESGSVGKTGSAGTSTAKKPTSTSSGKPATTSRSRETAEAKKPAARSSTR